MTNWIRRYVRQWLIWFLPEVRNSHRCHWGGFCFNPRACMRAEYCLTSNEMRKKFADDWLGQPMDESVRSETAEVE